MIKLRCYPNEKRLRPARMNGHKVLSIILFSLAMSIPSAGFCSTIERPLVFKVTPAGKSAPISYFLASQHWGVGLPDLPPKILDLFDSAEIVAFEMIGPGSQFLAIKKFLENPDDPENLYEALPETRTALRTDLTDKQIQTIVRLGIPRLLARIMPNKACSVFEMFRYFSGQKELMNLDAELILRAFDLKKQKLGLETEQDLDDVDREVAELGYVDDCRITDYLNNPENLKAFDAQMLEIRNRYLRMDPQKLMSHPESNDPSVVLRNERWLKKLEPLLRTKAIFVTAGFGHFPGKTGLIQLLRQNGFVVQALR